MKDVCDNKLAYGQRYCGLQQRQGRLKKQVMYVAYCLETACVFPLPKTSLVCRNFDDVVNAIEWCYVQFIAVVSSYTHLFDLYRAIRFLWVQILVVVVGCHHSTNVCRVVQSTCNRFILGEVNSGTTLDASLTKQFGVLQSSFNYEVQKVLKNLWWARVWNALAFQISKYASECIYVNCLNFLT